ncbi:40S ribosomal protein S15 [Pseudomonas sp. IT-P258]
MVPSNRRATAQNAGCTIAVHAECTKAKITNDTNLLFYILIYRKPRLAQSLQSSPYACHSRANGAERHEPDSGKIFVPVLQLRRHHPGPP